MSGPMDREALAQAIEQVAASVRAGQVEGAVVIVKHGTAGKLTACADWPDDADMVRCVSAALRTLVAAPDQKPPEVH